MEKELRRQSEEEKKDECLAGGKHEFETRQGGLGQTYQVCAKCGKPPPQSEHLGAH